MYDRAPASRPPKPSGLLLSCLLLGASACEPGPPPALAAREAPSAQTLVGKWKVDLRAKPDAPAYFQELVVTSVTERSFEGSFYGSPITQGRINTTWGAVRFAFVTEDGSGPYHHSGVLRGGRIEGLSSSTGRDFLAYWSAIRE